MFKEDDDDDDNSASATRYPCMPSLVALQQMRNRLHLAYTGKKLMKWTAMATGRELRKLAKEISEAYDNFREDMRLCFILLARARYFNPCMNDMVLENIGTEGLRIEATAKSISGVKVLQLSIVETNYDAYAHLGIAKGGTAVTTAKKAWRDLLRRIIFMLQLRVAFTDLEKAHKNATKKSKVISKVVVPRLKVTTAYINSELEEKEREDTFRLKRFKELKTKKGAKAIKTADVCSICKTKLVKYDSNYICPVCTIANIDVVSYEGQDKKRQLPQRTDRPHVKTIESVPPTKQVSDAPTIHHEPSKHDRPNVKPIDSVPPTKQVSDAPTIHHESSKHDPPNVKTIENVPTTKQISDAPTINHKPSKHDNKKELAKVASPCKVRIEQPLEEPKPSTESAQKSNSEEELGFVEKKFKEIIRVTRLQNDDGTISTEKQVITIRTERRNPSKYSFNNKSGDNNDRFGPGSRGFNSGGGSKEESRSGSQGGSRGGSRSGSRSDSRGGSRQFYGDSGKCDCHLPQRYTRVKGVKSDHICHKEKVEESTLGHCVSSDNPESVNMKKDATSNFDTIKLSCITCSKEIQTSPANSGLGIVKKTNSVASQSIPSKTVVVSKTVSKLSCVTSQTSSRSSCKSVKSQSVETYSQIPCQNLNICSANENTCDQYKTTHCGSQVCSNHSVKNNQKPQPELKTVAADSLWKDVGCCTDNIRGAAHCFIPKRSDTSACKSCPSFSRGQYGDQNSADNFVSKHGCKSCCTIKIVVKPKIGSMNVKREIERKELQVKGSVFECVKSLLLPSVTSAEITEPEKELFENTCVNCRANVTIKSSKKPPSKCNVSCRSTSTIMGGPYNEIQISGCVPGPSLSTTVKSLLRSPPGVTLGEFFPDNTSVTPSPGSHVDASTSTYRSARFDVRSLKSFTCVKSKSNCSCKSDSYLVRKKAVGCA